MSNLVLIVNHSEREMALLLQLLATAGVAVEFCHDGKAARTVIAASQTGFKAAFILWDLPAPPFAHELLLQCRHRWPQMPFVALFEELTNEPLSKAIKLGAKDVLQKPLEAERLRHCLQTLWPAQQEASPKLAALRATILGNAPNLIEELQRVVKAIESDRCLLIVSEPGTGKELVANAVHRLSPQPSAQFVAVNLAAIPEALLESQLFGHEKGAFTGAQSRHIGYFEQADNGTLFLDEIGELPQSGQVKLLRVLQEKEFHRLGGTERLPVNARLVCATNRQLTEALKSGRFRRDLFDRINQVQINLPPLRERRGDAELLAQHFLAKNRGNRPLRFARETLGMLEGYHWPGNVRELENAIHSALINCDGDLILPPHLPQSMLTDDTVAADDHHEMLPPELLAELRQVWPADALRLPHEEAVTHYLRAFDRVYLPALLERHRQNVTAAAKAAGWTPKTFRRRWQEANLPSLRGKEEPVIE